MTTLLVASTGGHLAQLHQLRRTLVPVGEPVVWCTFDSPQSRSLLEGETVEYMRYVSPRDWRGVLRNVPAAVRVVRRHGVDTLLTTGNAIALSFLPWASVMGVSCAYIESAARSTGPSTTGRIAAMTPRVKTYTQYESWASGRWPKTASVFDDYVPHHRAARKIERVLVTLGTIQGYQFRSLLEQVVRILPPGASVLCQAGNTEHHGLGIDVTPMMDQKRLLLAMAEADVVIAHAGVGSALAAMEVGVFPVLVPRRKARDEHVDDHQVQIARELHRRGLALHREVDALTMDDLIDASARVVGRR